MSRHARAGGTAADYMPEAFDPAEKTAWEQPWVWSFEDTKTAARMAKSRSRGTVLGNEAYGIAWEGVAAHVAEHPDSSWLDAVNAGARAVSDELSGHMHGQRTDGAATGGRFHKYWTLPFEPVSERFEEALALIQVIEGMEPKHRETLYLRARFHTDTEAAQHVGITQTGMSLRIRAARQAFYRAWFDWETPPPLNHVKPRSQATHCRNGHPWAENTQHVNTKKGRQRRCRTCNQESVARLRKESSDGR